MATSKIIEPTEADKARIFKKELPKMLLLVILYSFQGLPLGFFLSSVPIIFKKYLTYSQIGEIMLCTVPFSFKVFWSPFIEFYHIESVGKRRTWIIPTQLIMCVILFYLRGHLEDLLIAQEVQQVAFLLTTLVFIITCQDIAVDSWAIEMLHPCNATYGSSSQSIGQRIGSFMSTSLFISLNSAEFCSRWIYGTPVEETEPVLTLERWILLWSSFQALITFYIAFFVPEVDPELLAEIEATKAAKLAIKAKGAGSPRNKKKNKKGKNKHKKLTQRSQSGNKLVDVNIEERVSTAEDEQSSEEEMETEPDLRHTLAIFWDVICNRQLQIWFVYNFGCKAAMSINQNVASVYLTNDLGFPKETLSMIQVICTPLNIMFAVVSGYLAQSQPFPLQSNNLLIGILISSYSVLVLLRSFPEKEDITMWTTVHVTVVTLIADLISEFEFVTAFGILLKYTDKRLSGIHVTVMAAMYNMTSFLHKLYIFKLIDAFGIFIPQAVIGSLALILWFSLRKTFISLKDQPKKAWHISDSVIAKKEQ